MIIKSAKEIRLTIGVPLFRIQFAVDEHFSLSRKMQIDRQTCSIPAALNPADQINYAAGKSCSLGSQGLHAPALSNRVLSEKARSRRDRRLSTAAPNRTGTQVEHW